MAYRTSAVSPVVLESARLEAAPMLSLGPVVLLERAPEMAVLPASFAPGSPAVLIDRAGKASTLKLAETTVTALRSISARRIPIWRIRPWPPNSTAKSRASVQKKFRRPPDTGWKLPRATE